MEVIHPRCAGREGLCPCPGPRAQIHDVDGHHVGCDDREILDLNDFLLKEQVSLVVMEATSDYWRPFYYLLEDEGLAVVLVNARDARNVPGRKTGVSDAAWLADLGAHRLVRAPSCPCPRSGN